MPRNQEGFTILEVMISLTILVVGMLSLSSLQTASIGSNAQSGNVTIATMLAQDTLEDLRRQAYAPNGISLVRGQVTTIDGQSNNPINPAGLHDDKGLFTREWTVAYNQPGDNMKTVTVTVSWGFAGQKSVRLYAVMSEE